MKKLSAYLFLFFISFTSTQVFAASYGLEMILQDKIFSASEIAFDYQKWQNDKGSIAPPPATWVRLLKINSLGEEYCLFYRDQFEDKKGVLRLSVGTPCDDAYNTPKYSADKIENFDLSFDKALGAFKMNVTFKKGSESYTFYYPSFKERARDLRVLSDSSPTGPFSYLSLSPKTEPELELIGKFTDNYRDSSATLCHKVNAKCEDEIPNHCEQCAFGHFEVVDHLCAQGGSKFCGINRCGEQGQPACPRGELAAGRTLKDTEVLDWCSKESTAGFCQNGLTPTCDGNKILICL